MALIIMIFCQIFCDSAVVRLWTSLAAARATPSSKSCTLALAAFRKAAVGRSLRAPRPMMRAAAESNVHLEADIHALADNKHGFAEGEWVPYLAITFELTKDGGETVKGDLMPMVASDGPHYGDNIKLMGPGKYKLKFNISAPGSGKAHFGRHTDKETGVAPWFEPFTTEYEFVYAGIGKKGSY